MIEEAAARTADFVNRWNAGVNRWSVGPTRDERGTSGEKRDAGIAGGRPRRSNGGATRGKFHLNKENLLPKRSKLLPKKEKLLLFQVNADRKWASFARIEAPFSNEGGNRGWRESAL